MGEGVGVGVGVGGGGRWERAKFNIYLPATLDLVIILFALLMYFDVIVDDLSVCLLMLDCEFSVSQWLTKY